MVNLTRWCTACLLLVIAQGGQAQILIGQTAGFTGAVAAGVKETLEGAKDGPLAGQKDTVTLRHRDSMKQERISIADLLPRLHSALA